jgi:hypothetical protein
MTKNRKPSIPSSDLDENVHTLLSVSGRKNTVHSPGMQLIGEQFQYGFREEIIKNSPALWGCRIRVTWGGTAVHAWTGAVPLSAELPSFSGLTPELPHQDFLPSGDRGYSHTTDFGRKNYL